MQNADYKTRDVFWLIRLRLDESTN